MMWFSVKAMAGGAGKQHCCGGIRLTSCLMAVWVGLVACSTMAMALEPSEQLKDATLEARARELSAELRCLVCQNQSIDDSDAPLAKDLRRLVRERIVAGDNNAQVKSFLVERYGDFVLLKPPFGLNTLLLWLAPAVLLFAVLFYVAGAARRQAMQSPAGAGGGLSEDEERRLQEVLARQTNEETSS